MLTRPVDPRLHRDSRVFVALERVETSAFRPRTVATRRGTLGRVLCDLTQLGAAQNRV